MSDSIKYTNKSKEELIVEKNKIIAHCINLECKNEQLKVLIDKLHLIANKREELIANNKNKNFTNNFDYLKTNRSKILNELLEAKVNRDKLEKNISSLKSRIYKINEIISNDK